MLMLILLYTASLIGAGFAWGWMKEIKANQLLQQELEDKQK